MADEHFESVWDAIEDDPERRALCKAWSDVLVLLKVRWWIPLDVLMGMAQAHDAEREWLEAPPVGKEII